MTNLAFKHLLYSSFDGIAVITLNRPDKMNALGIGPGSNRDEISRALKAADADPAIGCIVIAANGPAFCAGGDLSGVDPVDTPFDEHLFSEHLMAFYADIRSIHKPILAAINGLCLGSGLGFIAQCDLVIAADDARFGLVEGRLGHPGATEIVPIIGAAWAKFLILTGEIIDAPTAREIGLVLTVEPVEQLLDRVNELAKHIAKLPREAVLLNKTCINRIDEAMGRTIGRMIGRAHDTITKSMSKFAAAPDGRRFVDIFREEGMEGLKKARDMQFTGSWLKRSK